MRTILFFDVETCGLLNDRFPDEHPHQPPLVQLGCLLVDADNGAELATLELIVKPDGYAIPTAASRVHGITTAMAETFGLPLAMVVPAFAHLRTKADAVAGYNLKYDLAVMRNAIARNGKPVSLSAPAVEIDVAELATPIVAIPPTERMRNSKIETGKFKTAKLTESVEFFFGRPHVGAHGALADARATKEVYFEIKWREADAVRSVAGDGASSASNGPPPGGESQKEEGP